MNWYRHTFSSLVLLSAPLVFLFSLKFCRLFFSHGTTPDSQILGNLP